MGTEDESKRSGRELLPQPDYATDDPEPRKFGEIIRKWPKGTFFIVMYQFCERFSYYGMQAVLTLYLINILDFNDNSATIFFHAFTLLAYSSPLLGSILADGYIGKFWTIFSISLVYITGQIVLAVSSTFKKGSFIHPYLDFVGLFFIAMGTGGISPCVSVFGADQFKSQYLIMISYYFSIVYYMINLGSGMSAFFSPEFRATPCLGQDSCYPLTFGIPAAFMIIATVIFMLGSFSYKKVPPKENVISRVTGTIKIALRNKFFRSPPTKRDHWLEYFLDTHKCENDPKCLALRSGKRHSKECAQMKFMDDIKSLVRVTIMMLPVPMFWALYGQLGSRWIIQAVAMNVLLTENIVLLPDQMRTLNAILTLLFIPLFQIIIYPGVEKLGIRTTPLRRMVVGGLLAAAAFVTSGFVQLAVNETLPDVPADNTAFLSVINSFPNCSVNVSIPGESVTRFIYANSSLIDDNVQKRKELYRLSTGDSKSFDVNLAFSGTYCYGHKNITYPVTLEGGKSYYIAATPQGILHNETHWDKPQEGEWQTAISINLMTPCNKINPNVTWAGCRNETLKAYADRLALCAFDGSEKQHPCDPHDSNAYYYWKKLDDDWHIENFTAWQNSVDDKTADASMTVYEFRNVKKGVYRLYYVKYPDSNSDRTPLADQITAIPVSDVAFEITGMGGVLTLTVSLNGSTNNPSATNIHNIHVIVPKNHVSILWQVPQYVIITASEVLFAITGSAFSYSQAPPSMKSVVQAIWLFTAAIGDLIIILIALIPESNLAIEMFVFAGAMIVVVGIFALMSVYCYEYVDYSQGEDNSTASTFSEVENDELSNGKINHGYDKAFDTSSDLRLRI